MSWTPRLLLDVILPVAAALAGLAAGIALRTLLFRRWQRGPEGSAPRLTEVFAALRGPIVLWGGIVGLYAALEMAALPARVERVTQRVLLAVVILSVSWTLAQLAAAWVTHVSRRGDGRLPGATIVTNVARLLVIAVGVLVLLQTLGIAITPVLTALGVGGLAVALALQDTLANLFAGIHILATRQIRPGDFIRLESGDEGYVQDVTWRNTTIRRLANNLVIVPNSRVSSAITTNYHLPDREEAVLVAVSVSYGSDLERVERVTIAVARELQRGVEGAVPQFEPFIRYNAFGDSSITFNVILRAREVTGQHLMRHELIKRLHAAYRHEGIEIPFPQRTVHLTQPEQRDAPARPQRR